MRIHKMILMLTFCIFSTSLFSADVQPAASNAGRLALVRTFDQFAKMALSPNGDKLALSSAKETKVWATNKNQEEPLCVATGHCGEGIMAVGFHPDGNTFATGCISGCLCVHDAQTGRALHNIPLSNGKAIHALALHPVKNECIVGNSCGEIELWNLEQKQKLNTIRQHPHPVTRLEYSFTGNHITAIHTHGVIERMNDQLTKATEPTDPNFDVGYWTDSHYVAKGFQDGSLILYKQGILAEGLKQLVRLTEQDLGSIHLEYDRATFNLNEKGNAAVDAGEYKLATYATKIAAVGIASNRLVIGLQDGEIIELLWKQDESDISISRRQLRAPIALSEQPDPREGGGRHGRFLTPIGKNIIDVVASANGSCFVSLARDLELIPSFNGPSTPKDAYKIHVWRVQPTEDEQEWHVVKESNAQELTEHLEEFPIDEESAEHAAQPQQQSKVKKQSSAKGCVIN